MEAAWHFVHLPHLMPLPLLSHTLYASLHSSRALHPLPWSAGAHPFIVHNH